MKYRLLLNNLGKILLIVAMLMLVPTIYSIVIGDNAMPFIWTSLIALGIGGGLSLIKAPKESLPPVDCLVIVALSWLIISILGALPYVISGYIPHFIDALFESTSGFTTTGSTILQDIESLPKSLLLYRSFTHWIGGLGILVFVLAIIPDINPSAYNMIKAESTRSSVSKIISKVSGTSRIMCLIYIVLTVIAFCTFLILGLDAFNSACVTFSAVGTGGFAPLNDSIAGYGNTGVEIAVTVFMFISSLNFALFYLILLGQIKRAFKNEELLWYVGIVLFAIIIIALNILQASANFWVALKDASFHVVSFVSTTGFVTQNVNTWPVLSQVILFALAFMGGCAGSTSGGVKAYRVCIMSKALSNKRRTLGKTNTYSPVKYNGEVVDENNVNTTTTYILTYICAFIICALLISIFDNINLTTTFSSSLASLSNVGIGFDKIQGFENYSFFSYPSKLIFTFEMLLGRLEILPLLALFSKRTWQRTI